MKKHLTGVLIYNPLAGPSDMTSTIERAAEFWRSRGWPMVVRPTRYPGHAIELAREAATSHARLVLAAGGDGTLGEVANGLADSETVMGPLPIGTGNSFGKELRMPRPRLMDHNGLIESAALLFSGRVQLMDLGRLESGRYWLLWTGTGLDGHIVKRIEPRSKLSKRLGSLGYAVQAIHSARSFPVTEAIVEIDGRQIEGRILMVLISNCRRFAGGEVTLNPDAVLDDGQFEVFIAHGHGFFVALRYFWQVWRGKHMDNPDITILRGQRVKVRTSPMTPLETDGDPAGESPFTCHVVPKALKILVPRTAPAGLFQEEGVPLF